MCGCYREKLHVHHLWELKGLGDLISDNLKSVPMLPASSPWVERYTTTIFKNFTYVLDDTDCNWVPPANKATCIERKEQYKTVPSLLKVQKWNNHREMKMYRKYYWQW